MKIKTKSKVVMKHKIKTIQDLIYLDKLSLPYYDLEIESIEGIEEFDFEKLFEFMSDTNGYVIYFEIWNGEFRFNSAGRGYYIGQGYEIHQNYDDGFKLQIVINGCASIYNRERFKELQSFL